MVWNVYERFLKCNKAFYEVTHKELPLYLIITRSFVFPKKAAKVVISMTNSRTDALGGPLVFGHFSIAIFTKVSLSIQLI